MTEPFLGAASAPVRATGLIPAGLIDAFWEYERALMANDLAALDRLFAPGESTARGDAAGLLIGHDAIGAFRQGRGGAPARSILAVEVHVISADAALIIAITSPATGGRGQQSQLWRLSAGAWVVAAAHVSVPAPAIASATWRVVGNPLVAGSTTGPLAGHTVAVKDLFEVEGFAVGAGVPAFLAEQKPAAGTADAVLALLDAGASVQGIAQTDEFAYSIAGRNEHYGTPPNPAVVGGVPGGSSSGPASAVATGQVTIGLGTDTGGSIRVPASYNGLWGLRTTHGAVSRSGLLPLAPTFDTVGWLTRDAASLRAAAEVSLDVRAQSPVSPDFVIAPGLSAHLTPGVRRAFDSTLESVAGVGAIGRLSSVVLREIDLREIDLGEIDRLFEAFRMLQAVEAWRSNGAWVRSHPGALGADIAARFAFAAAITEGGAEDPADRAVEEYRAARASLDAILGDSVLLLPSASSVAPSMTASADDIESTRAGTLRLTCIAGITGRPAISAPLMSVPLSSAATPAPVGLCLVGPQFTDLALIGLAERIARAL